MLILIATHVNTAETLLEFNLPSRDEAGLPWDLTSARCMCRYELSLSLACNIACERTRRSQVFLCI